MPAFSHFALQTSLYNELINDTSLMNLIEGVYDRVPDDAAFPYVTLGDIRGRDWSSKIFSGMQYTIEINVFSREGGRKESTSIMERIYSLLHEQSLAVTGQTLVMLRFLSSDIFLEKDGWSYHGRLRFNALLQAD